MRFLSPLLSWIGTNRHHEWSRATTNCTVTNSLPWLINRSHVALRLVLVIVVDLAQILCFQLPRIVVDRNACCAKCLLLLGLLSLLQVRTGNHVLFANRFQIALLREADSFLRPIVFLTWAQLLYYRLLCDDGWILLTCASFDHV